MKLNIAKTTVQKKEEIDRKWVVVDANGQVLVKLAVEIAAILIGNKKPAFSPHVDNGDYVVVINAKNIKVTGRKADQKMYYRHSGYVGSLKEETFKDRIERDPAGVISDAVKGMIPKNKLAALRLARLRVFAGSEHNHEAQKPTEYKVGDIK